jgi:hypothetical protein
MQLQGGDPWRGRSGVEIDVEIRMKQPLKELVHLETKGRADEVMLLGFYSLDLFCVRCSSPCGSMHWGLEQLFGVERAILADISRFFCFSVNNL